MDHKRVLKKSVTVLGEFTIFVGRTVQTLNRFWRRRDLFLRQCEFIGVTSIGIVFFAALFLGAVLGYQLIVSYRMFGAEALMGGAIGIALFRELGPVVASIMVTGRAGAAMAAQIASMRITEQIDALEVMAVNPVEYLVMPRVSAGVIMMPLLSVFFAAVGITSAAFIACGVMDLSYVIYWIRLKHTVDTIDLIHCTAKGAMFGLLLTWIGCFCGFRAYGGARAVGFATRTTVVASCLAILFSDYFLTSLLPFGFEKLKVQ